MLKEMQRASSDEIKLYKQHKATTYNEIKINTNFM